MIISDALTWNLISNPDVNSSVLQVWKMRVGHLNLLTADAAAGVAGRSAGYDGVCFWNRPHMILMIEIREFSWHIYVICTHTQTFLS